MPYAAINPLAMPHIVLAGQNQQLPWHHGPHFTSRLAAGYTRVSDFGLMFGRTKSCRLRDGMGSWRSEACRVTQDALCEQMAGERSQMLFLPMGPVEVPEDYSQLLPNSFTSAFPNGSSCASGDSGRTSTQLDQRYEVSLCDLVDGQIDLVYDNAAGRIFWRQDTTGVVIKIFVGLLSVYIVSCVAENIKRIITKQHVGESREQQAALVVTVLFLAYEVLWNDLLTCIVTQAELNLFYLLFAYTALECVLQHDAALEMLLQHDDVRKSTLRSKVSPLTICLLLLLLRVYYTFETPYTLPLTILFGTRNWYKVLCLRDDGARPRSRADFLVLALDLLVYAALLSAGIQQHAASAVDGLCDQVMTLALSTLMGTVLFVYRVIIAPEPSGAIADTPSPNPSC